MNQSRVVIKRPLIHYFISLGYILAPIVNILLLIFVARIGLGHILDRLFKFNRGPWAAPGSFHTVAPYAYKFSDSFPINHGASQRHIFTPDNWDNSYSILPTGNSGIPASDHYCDQTDMYMGFEYQPDLFSLERIREAAVYVQELRP